MKQFLKELFEYNHYVNQKLGDIFVTYPNNTTEKSIKLYNHLLNAHQIWNNRIESKHLAFGVWQIHPMQNCKNIDRLNYQNSLFIIDKLDLDNKISYTNTKGEDFSNSIRDMLFHIINHSTYHRAQIATEFKHHDLDALNTDYIFFKR